jgi:propanol-preferring alcohol dehydrogenase
VKALRLLAWQQLPTLIDVPIPNPGPSEVVLRVGGAGVCHSDLHLMDWPAGQLDFNPPFTLGHENAGWVAAVGAGVSEWREGDPVAVYGPWGCGVCKTCRLGMENYCEHVGEGPMAPGIGRDGGMAEYLRVPARLLVSLKDLDPVQAAPLTDAALTPYHAVKRSLSVLLPGSTAVVIGAGGLGHLAIQIVRALSPAAVVAVDLDDDRLALAREVGADHTVLADEDAADQIQRLTDRHGADLVLDLVGSDASLALAGKSTRVLGHLTVVGLAMGTLPFSFFALPYECALATTYWGSITELMEVIDLARAGRLRLETTTYPLEKALDVYEQLRAGAIRGRAVIVPN